MSRIHRRAHRARSRACAIAATVFGVALGTAVVQAPAEAASTPVTVKAVSSRVVPAGAMTTVVPRYSAGKNVRVLSARVDVKRGSTWVARGVRRAKVPAGTYRVTTKVSYRQRVSGKLSAKRVKRHSYTLRLTPAPVVSPAPAPSYVPPPTPAPAVTRVPAPSSLTRTSSGCYDASLVKANGTAWTCTFFDDFSGTTLDRSKWTPVETSTSGYQIGHDCFVDDPRNIAVGSGALSLTVRKLSSAQPCAGARKGDENLDHTAGSVILNDAFAQSRGRFEIRAAFPATTVAGHHSALWMFPADPTATWPMSGEIDIAEYYSRWHGRAIPYIHYGSTDPSVTNNYCFIADPTAFNTYTLEWTATTMSIAYNGQTCLTHEISDDLKLPFEGQFKLLLTQGLGVGDGEYGNVPTDKTPDIGTTKVDYVRIWK